MRCCDWSEQVKSKSKLVRRRGWWSMRDATSWELVDSLVYHESA
jgi:hypothetical protein